MWRYKIKCSGVKCHHICNQRLTGEEKKGNIFICVCVSIFPYVRVQRERNQVDVAKC